jgi:tRNA A37 N6-isopentenylltransferase MiaA
MENLLQQNTQRLAKRQRTWFRRYIADEKENPKKNVKYKVWYLD